MSDTAQTHPGEMFERPALEALAFGTASVLRGSWTVISALVAGLLVVAILTTYYGRVRTIDRRAGVQTVTLSVPAHQLP
ncbi:MAG: hypothetical protein V7604_1451 [Hyphomicrobiales bacterium]|jgi:hypothetical protein